MTHQGPLVQSAAAFFALSLVTAVAPAPARATEPTPVVATFSILGDMVQRVGGRHVAVTTLVGANGDTHVYQPTPADARAVTEAKLLFVNGLDFEGWIDRLVDASDFDGTRIVATKGLEPIPFSEGEEDEHDDHGHDKHSDDEHGHDEHGHDEHGHDEHGHDEHGHDEHGHDEHGHDGKHEDHAGAGHEEQDGHGHDHHDHGAFDPHTWQSLKNAVTYVDNITAALAQTDPANAADFYRNRAAYVAEIKALDARIHAIVASLPTDRRTVVTSHDAFQYFGRDYGLRFLAPQGLSTESEASARDVARLIEQMREQAISAVFVENITDVRLLERIAAETAAKIGGTLYPGALSGPDGPAPTYLDLMRHNATTLAEALGS